VLSILNRLTGLLLSGGGVVLVAWLVAGSAGPQAYAVVQGAIGSWIGGIILLGATFAFFFHLCGGIRHLVWDTVHGFELRSIYISGWAVVAAAATLTAVAWIAGALMEN
jgi:succinate dehydrogenase / fumarate reductase cytochrome b subunit